MALWRWLFFAAVGLFVTYTALHAISESWDNEGFPEALTLKLELMPLIFPLHMVTGGLALLLVPVTLMLRGTSWPPMWHKRFGRITALDVTVAAITAVPVALNEPITPISAAGFTAQAFAWMLLLGLGLWHIRNNRIAQHRACMLMMAAVTSGAVFFRIWLALWTALGPREYFDEFYGINAWIAWGLPLIGMTFCLNRNSAFSANFLLNELNVAFPKTNTEKT
jgi:uncharacterized membrane protein YozB (DUF420 family)